MLIVKNSGFITHRRREDRKSATFGVLEVGVLSFGYSLHITSDLHAKSMDY